MAILLIFLVQVASATAAAPDCPLDVTRVRTIRKGAEAWTYRHADWKNHATLAVHSREVTVAHLSELGLVRRSHACRLLRLKTKFADCLKQKVRLTYLKFDPTSREVAHHAHESLVDGSIRERMAQGLSDRRHLLATVVSDNSNLPTVYHFVYGSEFLGWLDMEESAAHGPTRFATRTWMAQTLRELGVAGAVMVGGRLPEQVGPPDGPPVRYKHWDRDVVENGPAVLFFQPSRP